MRHVAVLAAAAVLSAAPAVAQDDQAVAIVGVTVIDGTGAEPRTDTTVLVQGGRIVAVGPAGRVAVPDGALRVDGNGRFLIPGLWDMHVHLTKIGATALPLFVANGITAVRDVGSDFAEVDGWRREISAGERIGPYIKTSGPILESAENVARMKREGVVEPFERVRVAVAGPADAARVVDSLASLGVDFLKIRTYASRETYFAIAEAARRAGLPLAGHASDLSPEDILRSGQRTIEHFLYPTLDDRTEEQRIEAFRRLGEAGVALVSTGVVGTESLFVPIDRQAAVVYDSLGLLDARRRYVSEWLLADWREQLAERQAEPVDLSPILPSLRRNQIEMRSAGMTILPGTDAGVVLIYPGFQLHDELKNLVDTLGMSPMEALVAATTTSAEFLGVADSTGTIQAGKRADLVLLDADPLRDITNTRKIAAVFAAGCYYDREALDAILDSVAQSVAAPPLVREPFTLSGFDGVETAAELGKLTVLADRGSPGSGTVELAFVRLPSTSDWPGSPIVFLAGGPGVPGIVMGQVPVYRGLFERLRAVGDVILLDQRGTGRSAPSLDCPADSVLPVDVLLDQARALAGLLPPLEVCAVRLRTQGVEPADYTTAASADDIDDLRRALGAERVSLLGFSYGTELALAYVRRHGEAVDRLVLAAVRPPWSVIKLPSTYEPAIAALSVLAAGDADSEIGDFREALRRSLDRLAAAPVSLSITDRRTNGTVELAAGKVALQAILQLGGLSDGRRMPGVVAMVAALDRGEPELFRREVERLYNGLAGGIGLMGIAMNCSAGWSADRRLLATAQGETALLGDVANLMLVPEACAIAGDPDLGPDYRAPVESERPALFLSGSLDPNAPPAQAEEVLPGFPNGVHIVVENGSHETLPADEVQALVADFFGGADVAGRAVSLPEPDFPSPAAALEPPRGPGP